MVFFVSTAPLATDGLVNCSPKGLDTFRVLDERSIAYLDLAGSGVGTIVHLKENGRMTIMMYTFEGPPKVFRFYGRGKVFEKGALSLRSSLALSVMLWALVPSSRSVWS